jgi:predicted dehydrogenase
MVMDTLRFAVAGTGSIIREFHLPVLLKNPRAEVVAAANLHPRSLDALVSDFGIPTSYNDFDQLAGDPNVDAVVIGLPNYLNATVAIKMLRAGKHVLCEKPMARTVEEAKRMLRASEDSAKTLMIAHVWRSNEEVRWLRELVTSGILGSIFKCKAHAVSQSWGPLAGSWRVKAELSGGGVFADVGIHAVDTLAFLFGDRVHPIKLFAAKGNFFQKLEVEDTASVMMQYDNGMTIWIEAGWYHNFANSPHGAIEVFGTKGYARLFPTEFHYESEGKRIQDRPFGPPTGPHIDMKMYATQIDDFIQCALAGRAPLCDGRSGLENMKIMEAVYESATTGQVVALHRP